MDIAGNRDPTPASFSWTILTPDQAIQQLIQTVHRMGLNPGTETTLTALLYTAYFHLVYHDDGTACIQLTAFVNLANGYGRGGQLQARQLN